MSTIRPEDDHDGPENEPGAGPDDKSVDLVASAVALLFGEASPEGKAEIVRRHADRLLGPEADRVLWALIGQCKGDDEENALELARVHRQYLRRCVREGIERAASPINFPRGSVEALAELLATRSDDEIRRVIAVRGPELFHPALRERPALVSEFLQDDWPVAHDYFAQGEFLRQLRGEARNRSFQGFADASPGKSRVWYARKHPEIFDPEFEFAIAASKGQVKAAERRFLERLEMDYRAAAAEFGYEPAPPVSTPLPKPTGINSLPPEQRAEGAAIRAIEVRLAAHDPNAAGELVAACRDLLGRPEPALDPEYRAVLMNNRLM